MPSRIEPVVSSCCFDLECSALTADFGIILAAVVKGANAEPVVFRLDELNKDWKTKRSNDAPLVRAVADELSKYDILIAHNGVNFDLPFLRTRMLYHGMKAFPEKKVIDPVQIARKRLRLSRNTLARVAGISGAGKKFYIDSELWIKATLDGDIKAMDAIVEHCKQDVALLEGIVHHIKDYSPTFNSWGSA